MDILLTYGLLPLFFVIFLALITLVFLRGKSPSAVDMPQHENDQQERMVTYFSLGVLFVLLLFLTFFTGRTDRKNQL